MSAAPSDPTLRHPTAWHSLGGWWSPGDGRCPVGWGHVSHCPQMLRLSCLHRACSSTCQTQRLSSSKPQEPDPALIQPPKKGAEFGDVPWVWGRFPTHRVVA